MLRAWEAELNDERKKEKKHPWSQNEICNWLKYSHSETSKGLNSGLTEGLWEFVMQWNLKDLINDFLLKLCFWESQVDGKIMLLQCRIGLRMAYKLKVMKTKDSYDLEVSNIFYTIVKKKGIVEKKVHSRGK